jgi:hypothetical protein
LFRRLEENCWAELRAVGQPGRRILRRRNS